jgi:hypothetical protein
VPYPYNLIIWQGSKYIRQFPVLDDDGDPINVDGWTARAQIRAYARSASALYTLAPVCSGTTVTITIPAADSSLWTWRTGLWDLELLAPVGDPEPLVNGHVVVHPEITR